MTASEGRTLFQIAKDALAGKSPPVDENPKVELPANFYNPLGFALGGYVRVGTTELSSATFSVDILSELTRSIGGKALKVTDYSLHDPDFGEAKDGTWLTVRCIDQGKGKFDCVLLFPHQEMKYSLDMEKKLKAKEYVDKGAKVKYQKFAENKASLREIPREENTPKSITYYDYVNNDGPELRLYVIEVNDETGWIQTYHGTPLDPLDVKAIAGHV